MPVSLVVFELTFVPIAIAVTQLAMTTLHSFSILSLVPTFIRSTNAIAMRNPGVVRFEIVSYICTLRKNDSASLHNINRFFFNVADGATSFAAVAERESLDPSLCR